MADQSTQSSSGNSALKELTSNHLPLLCNTLNPVAPKCFELGLQLGVEKTNIEIIMADITNNCQAQLREIISERLKQDSPLTWHDIVTALTSPSVNRPDLARHIESQYIPPASHESAKSSHMTSVMQVPPQYSFKAQSHTPQILSPSANGMGMSQPPLLLLPEECRSQPLQSLNIRIPSPYHPSSFQSYSYCQPQLHHSQAHPHIPPQYTSPSFYPSPQWQQQSLPLNIPSSSIYHSSDEFSSRFTSATLANQSSFQHTQPDSVYVSESIPPHTILHAQAQSMQAGWSTPYGCTPHMYPPQHMSHFQAAHYTIPQSYCTTPHMLPQNTRRHHVELLGGQWEHMPNSQLQTSYALSQSQSGSSGLGLSPPPSKRPHFEPQTLPVRSNNELQSTYYQLQTSSSARGLGSLDLPAKTTRIMSPMDQYIDYIKNYYQQSVIEKDPSALKWPPTPSEVFINLACIDRRTTVKTEEADEYTRALIENGDIDVILKKKTTINFNDIAQGLPTSERVVLVEGAPGVGKSTFAWEFCRRWERREIAQQYQLVLLLRLRDDRMSRATNLQDLIYHPNMDVSHDVKCELVDSHGFNTLIILEGFDELPDSQRKESSIFLQLILGQILLSATIMITSRPWATSKILRRIEHRVFQRIEVLGFTEENVVKYIKSAFTEKSRKTASAIDQIIRSTDDVSKETKKDIDNVIAYLNTYPQIKACMYIPLNAAIVVSIHQESKMGKCILPKTLTELYYALTQVLLLRYLYGHADYKEREWHIDSFEKDLPDKVYRQLLSICKVAYDGVCRKGKKRVQLIFSDHDLGGCETLGFMQSVAEVFVKHGWKMSHSFLHLTVQEFLAAVHISKMSLADQLKHFQKHEDGRLKVVLRFLAGCTQLKKVTPDEFISLLGKPTLEENDEQHILQSNES